MSCVLFLQGRKRPSDFGCRQREGRTISRKIQHARRKARQVERVCKENAVCFHNESYNRGETRLNTLIREFREEIGIGLGVELTEEAILIAPKVCIGKKPKFFCSSSKVTILATEGGSIVVLIEHVGPVISREDWNKNNSGQAQGAGLNEMCDLEFFLAKSFPCCADIPATTFPEADGRCKMVSCSEYFVKAVNKFKLIGALPSIVCKYNAQCQFLGRCKFLHAPPPCKYFANGGCKRGLNCDFAH